MRVMDLILKVPSTVKFDKALAVEDKLLPLNWNLSDISSRLTQSVVHFVPTYGKTTLVDSLIFY